MHISPTDSFSYNMLFLFSALSLHPLLLSVQMSRVLLTSRSSQNRCNFTRSSQVRNVLMRKVGRFWTFFCWLQYGVQAGYFALMPLYLCVVLLVL
jgi:hypothetical protein